MPFESSALAFLKDADEKDYELKIIEGYYKRFRARYPFAKEPCKSCQKVSVATVWKTEA